MDRREFIAWVVAAFTPSAASNQNIDWAESAVATECRAVAKHGALVMQHRVWLGGREVTGSIRGVHMRYVYPEPMLCDDGGLGRWMPGLGVPECEVDLLASGDNRPSGAKVAFRIETNGGLRLDGWAYVTSYSLEYGLDGAILTNIQLADFREGVSPY